MEEQHIYHHSDNEPKVNLSAERNSKGWNYGATVLNASSVSEAIKLLKQATKALEEEYGAKES